MNKEKLKPDQQSIRDLESRHFDPDPLGGVDAELFKDNKDAFEVAKTLLRIKEAKLIMDIDSENSNRALVKNSKGEIIFTTDLPFEIEELANIAYDTFR